MQYYMYNWNEKYDITERFLRGKGNLSKMFTLLTVESR